MHLSEGCPWRALPVILTLWSPDFPHVTVFTGHAWLPNPLTLLLYRKHFDLSNEKCIFLAIFLGRSISEAFEMCDTR